MSARLTPLLRSLPEAPTSRTRRLCLLMAGAAALTACATRAPSEVDIAGDKLQAAIARQFPKQLGLAGVVEAALQAPALQFLPNENRVRAQIATTVSGAVLPRAYDGGLDVDFGLRYEPSDHTVRAKDVRIHSLVLTGAPARLNQLLQSQLPKLAMGMADDLVLYQVKPEDARRAQAVGFVPGEIRVMANGLKLIAAPR